MWIYDEPGRVKVDDEKFDKTIRVLAVSELPGDDKGPGEEFLIANVEHGLPGGRKLDRTGDLFKKFEIRVKADRAQFRPPAKFGDSGAGVPVNVDFRVTDPDHFTGAILRGHKVPSPAESNDVEALNSNALGIFKEMRRDFTAGSTAEADTVRKTIAAALTALASAIAKNKVE